MRTVLCIVLVLLLVFSFSTAFAQKGAAAEKTYELKQVEKTEQPVKVEKLTPKLDAEKTIRQKMGLLGFRLAKIEKVGDNKYTVTVAGWDPDGMKPACKGAVSWDPGDKPRAAATLEVEIASNGIVSINSNGLKEAGIKINFPQLPEEVGIIEIPSVVK